MSKIVFICEGASEKLLVERILIPYFNNNGLSNTLEAEQLGFHNPNCLGAGGCVSYERLKIDLNCIMQNNPDAYVTTIFDYYALKGIWPGQTQTTSAAITSHEKAQAFESAVWNDLIMSFTQHNIRNQFIPNFLMHELEGLLFTDPAKITKVTGARTVTAHLQGILQQFNDKPEDINDSRITAPSIRLKTGKANYSKNLHAHQIVNEITVDAIRAKCPHFNAWLDKLEAIQGE